MKFKNQEKKKKTYLDYHLNVLGYYTCYLRNKIEIIEKKKVITGSKSLQLWSA